jgi:hypothetical protein
MKRVAEPRPTEESRASIAVISYAGGRFTDSDLTAEQMVENRGKMKEMHGPGFSREVLHQRYPDARTLGQTVGGYLVLAFSASSQSRNCRKAAPRWL